VFFSPSVGIKSLVYVVLALNSVTDKDLRKTCMVKFPVLGATMLLLMIMVLLMIRGLTSTKLQILMEILKISLGGKPKCIVSLWV